MLEKYVHRLEQKMIALEEQNNNTITQTFRLRPLNTGWVNIYHNETYDEYRTSIVMFNSKEAAVKGKLPQTYTNDLIYVTTKELSW